MHVPKIEKEINKLSEKITTLMKDLNNKLKAINNDFLINLVFKIYDFCF